MPLHYQLRLQIERMVNNGEFPAGQPLPPEEFLGRDLRVARGTVRRAMTDLVNQGILYRVPGRGTFVRPDAIVGHRVLILSIANAEDQEFFLNIRTFLMEAGHTAVLKPLNMETVEWMGHAHEIAGALILRPYISHIEILRRAAMLSIPLVLLGGNVPDIQINSVGLDNADGVRQAIEHFRSLGHRRIGYIGASPRDFDSRDRFDAFEQIIRDNGMDGMREMIPMDRDWKLGVVDILESWRSSRFPTAILAGGFGVTMYALDRLRQMGISVPADVSLIGFDDNPIAEVIQPPLTVLRQPHKEMPQEALKMLVAAIKTPQEWRVKKKLIPPELIVRASCARIG